jgi:hypothetical protein
VVLSFSKVKGYALGMSGNGTSTAYHSSVSAIGRRERTFLLISTSLGSIDSSSVSSAVA